MGFTQLIFELAPVFTGALIALAGGLIGTRYAHSLSSDDARRREQLARLEHILAEVYGLSAWLNRLEKFYFYGREEVLEVSPMVRIKVLNDLYFPRLAPSVEQLSVSYENYMGWLIEGAKLRLDTASNMPPNSHSEKVLEFYRPIVLAKGELIEGIKDLSREINKF